MPNATTTITPAAVLSGCVLRVSTAVEAVVNRGYAPFYRIRTTSAGGKCYVEIATADGKFLPVGRLDGGLNLILLGCSHIKRGSRRLAVIALAFSGVFGNSLAALAGLDWGVEVE